MSLFRSKNDWRLVYASTSKFKYKSQYAKERKKYGTYTLVCSLHYHPGENKYEIRPSGEVPSNYNALQAYLDCKKKQIEFSKL